MVTFFRQHRIAIFFALVVGAIAVLPTILAPLTLHGGYKGILFAPLNDENFYRATIHDVLDGHPFSASPFSFEYKDSAPTIIPPFNYWLYALPAFVVGLSATIIAGKFLLPGALFFLAYLLMRSLLARDANRRDATPTAIAAGLLIVIGYEFVNYEYVVRALFGHAAVLPLLWTRPVNPIMGAIEVFGFLILIYRLWIGEVSWKTILAAAIILAISASYYFSFGICMAVLGSLIVLALLQKEYVLTRNLLCVAGVSLIIDSWYWWSVLSAIGDQTTIGRNGMFYTHSPHFNKFLLFATIIVFALFLFEYVWKKRLDYEREWFFLAALLAGCWIAFNEQVLTGREIWYYHFVQYSIPLGMVGVLTAFYVVLRPRAPRTWRIILYAVCSVTLAYGLFSTTSYRFHTDGFTLEQSYAPMFSWLEEHTPRDCVVYVNEQEFGSDYPPQVLIPAYTHCNVYNSQGAEVVPIDRLMHNYFIGLRMMGVPPSQLRSYLMSHELEVRNLFYDNWLQQTVTGPDPWFSSKVDWLVAAYPAFYNGNLKDELLKYKMDYLASPSPLPSAILAQLPGLKVRAQVDPYVLYSF